MSNNPLVSILMPAFHSEPFITRAVESVLAQTYEQWELIIIADDLKDYQSLLSSRGINDPRIVFCSTGKVGSGSSPPRNLGLDIARGDIIAPLDSDDLFHKEKIKQSVPYVIRHGIVTTGFQEIEFDSNGIIKELRKSWGFIGSRFLNAETAIWYLYYNLTNTLSLHDRNKIPVRWNESIPVMVDLVFILSAFNYIDGIYFIDEALHYYTYRPDSLSHNADSAGNFLSAKKKVMQSIEDNKLSLPADIITNIKKYLSISLAAEEKYLVLLKDNKNLRFSDVLESLIDQSGIPRPPYLG